MAPVSLKDSSVTSASPGVLVKGTVDPTLGAFGNTDLLLVVSGNNPSKAINDPIDSNYIVGGATAYWSILLLGSGMDLYLSGSLPSIGGGSGPQFTETAEDNIWIVLFYDSTSAAWDFSVLDNYDEDEPYNFNSASVAAAGPAISNALKNAINADSSVEVLLVDSSHPRIDIANLQLRDAAAPTPSAPAVPATPTLAQISGDSDSLRATWSAVTGAASYQGQYKKTSDSGWTTISGNITSPHQINGLDANTSYDFRLRATNNSGSSNYSSAASATTAVAVVTPDPIGWSSPTRLDSIVDLTTIFDRANTGSRDGAWILDSGASTGSSGTGPGTNSSGPYVHSETSSGSFSTIPAKSTLTVKSAVMATWTGMGRNMLLRAAIAGAFSSAEGLQVEGRASGADSWAAIELLEGWPYGNGYLADGAVTDAAGDSQTFVQDGGWVDFAVAIPDAYTQVRIYVQAISGGNFYEHDIALWQVELADGTLSIPQPQEVTASPSITGTIAVTAPVTQLSPQAQETTASPSITGSVTVVAPVAQVSPQPQQVTAAPSITGTVTVAAPVTQVLPQPQQVTASPTITGTIAVIAPVTQVSPQPQEVTASPSITGTVSVAAPVTQGLPQPQQVTAAPSITGIVTVAAPVTQVLPQPLLALDDFDTTGLELEALALFTAGTQDSAGRIWGRSPRTVLGTLESGEFDINNDTQQINEIRVFATTLRFLKNGGTAFSTLFDPSSAPAGILSDLTITFQTGADANQIASWTIASEYLNSGGNFLNISIPSAHRALLNGIGNGDRFLVALTKVDLSIPQPQEVTAAPTITGTIAVVAPVTQVSPQAQEVTAAPSITGAVTVTAPVTQGSPQPQQVTASPSITGNLSVTAPVTQGSPQPQQVTASPSITGTIAVVAPVTQGSPLPQEVTAAPSITGNLSVTAPVTQGLPQPQQVTAAPSISGTVAVTAPVSIVSPAPPGQPAAPVVRSGPQGLLTVTWSSPADVGAGVSGYNLRFRISGTPTWTTRSSVPDPYTITGLNDNTSYEVQIRAFNQYGGDGPWSPTGTGTTTQPPSFTLGNYKLEADWDRDGMYNHAMSDLFYFLIKMKIHTKRGRNYGTQIFGRSVAGGTSITLRNEGDEFDRFNTRSALHGVNIIGTPVRLMMEDLDTSGVYRYLWSGYIDKTNFKQKRGGQDEITFICKDLIVELQLAGASAPARADVTCENAARILLNAGGITDDKIGDIQGDFMMEHWWSNRQSLLRSIREIEETEGGFFWVDEENRANLDDSTKRTTLAARTAKLTLVDGS